MARETIVIQGSDVNRLASRIAEIVWAKMEAKRPKMATLDEIAKELRLTKRTLQVFAQTMPREKIGGKYIYNKKEFIEAYKESKRKLVIV